MPSQKKIETETEFEDKVDLAYYLAAVNMTERFYNFCCHSLPGFRFERQYEVSYFTHIGLTDRARCTIHIKNLKGLRNNSFSISSYMVGLRLKPYTLSLWKYDGDHLFKYIDLAPDEITEAHFGELLGMVKEFYRIKGDSGRFEQLTLF